MPDLDETVSKPSSPASSSQSRPPAAGRGLGIAAPLATAMRPIAFLRRYWDFLAVLLLMAASLPLSWFSPHTVILVQHPGAFDDHWVLDSAFKSSRGIIFGRDVAFVYGPVFQWLMAAPARWPNFSMGSVYVSNRTLLLWCTFLFAHGTLRLLLPEQPAWKRFLLLVLLAIFWAPWDGRTACAIFLFALFLRGWYAVRDQRLKPLLFAGGCALLTAVAFLYSADTGVYGVAAWLLGLGGVAWEGRESRKFARCAAVAAGGFAVCLAALVLVINSIMAAPLDFRFWRTSLALVAVHRWNEPYPISAMGALHLLAPVVIGACLFLVRFAVPADRTAVITARTGFLLSAFLFALLSTQSGLIRSDYNHIVFGVYPMVFFAGAVLFSFPSRAASAVAALAAVACSLVFSQPALQFQPSNIRYRLTRMRHPITGCPGGFREFDRVCYPSGFAGTLETTVGYLQRHSGENDSVLIFPYQYMFAVAAQRNVAAGVEQSFLANGPYLSQFDTAGMERAQAQAGLYFPDAGPAELTSPTLSLPIDEVSNFTRTPDIWFWIFRHYRSDEELAPGILALQWDDSRQARISVQDYPLAVVARDFPIYAPTAAIDLGAPDWPAGGADFLRLRMTIRYSPLWKLRKPERLQLEITLADGSRSLRTFVAEPNVASDVWFYPWNQADLAGYFAGDEGRWRAAPRPAVTSLRLLITPLDWFSQQPESVEIDSVDAVRLSMRQ